MMFCGDVLELVEKYKILEDKAEFIKWTNIENNPNVEVYIESMVLPDLEQKELIIIDVIIGEVHGEKIGILFIKKQGDVYG